MSFGETLPQDYDILVSLTLSSKMVGSRLSLKEPSEIAADDTVFFI